MFALFQSGPRRGRALAAILAVAASGSLVVFAEDAPAPAAVAAPAAAGTSAGTSAPAAPNENSQMQVENDLGTLDRILSLSPERLTALRKAIENVEKMPQAERDQLKREIQSRMQSLRQLVGEMGTDMRQLSSAENSVLRKYQLTLYTDQLQALQERFHKAETPEARKAIIQELLKTAADKGIKPDPTPDRGQQPPAGGSRGNPAASGRGGRGSQNGPGDNGRGGLRGSGTPRPPMPAPLPPPQ